MIEANRAVVGDQQPCVAIDHLRVVTAFFYEHRPLHHARQIGGEQLLLIQAVRTFDLQSCWLRAALNR